LNTAPPIDVTPSWIVTLVNPLHPENAPPPMVVTLCGKNTLLAA
jgi:hypothetical protein